MSFIQPRYSQMTETNSLSISAGGERCIKQKTKVEMESIICEPTMEPERDNAIPPEFLTTALEANLGRFGRFCSENYIYDPSANTQTAKIALVIQLIRSRLEN